MTTNFHGRTGCFGEEITAPDSLSGCDLQNRGAVVMRISIGKMLAYFAASPQGCEREEDRSKYERLAVPFTFKPQLSFVEAVIASMGALLRILLGSALFAVWGAYSLAIWSTFQNPLLRVVLLLALLVAFLASFALLMIAITALVRKVLPRSP
jgi:hypothetical protein